MGQSKIITKDKGVVALCGAVHVFGCKPTVLLLTRLRDLVLTPGLPTPISSRKYSA